MVTVIRGFAIDNDLGELLSHLKSSCGAGGTSRSGEVELQGQHLLRVRAALAAMGFSVKG